LLKKAQNRYQSCVASQPAIENPHQPLPINEVRKGACRKSEQKKRERPC